MDENINFVERNLQYWCSQNAVCLQSFSKARLHKALAAKYRKILSLLYLGLSLLLHSIGSGITFIIFATFILLQGWGDRDFLYWQVTEEGWEGSQGHLYFRLLLGRNKDLIEVFVFTRGLLLTPPSSGRWPLSRTAWRRRRAGPRSLLASCWRLEPFTGCIWAPAWLRRLWTAAGDFQDHWRAVRMWNAGSCSGVLAVLPLRLSRHQVIQSVEGSERGLFPLSERPKTLR